MKTVSFNKGIHPAYNKSKTAGLPIATLDDPDEVVIPLSQHIGAPAVPCVDTGTHVRIGDLIADAAGFISAPIHASVSGTVTAIEPRPCATGMDQPCVIISNDGQHARYRLPSLDWKQSSPEDIKERVRAAGIVGLGGATFPTAVKLSPSPSTPIDTVILNGAECEPYLTADHRLMLERAAHVVEGLEIIQKVLDAGRCIIGVEDNKPDAAMALQEATSHTDITIVSLETKYPQGGEKQLIDAVLGRTVPSGKLPMDIGVVVQNVGTASAVRDAVVEGIPLTHRVVTVSGDGVRAPGNFLIAIGTPVAHVLEHCQTTPTSGQSLIMGGPMMGTAMASSRPPVIKGTSGILLLETIKTVSPGPCIRCGRCVTACPMNLVPAEIGTLTDRRLFEQAARFCPMDCMECGSCAYACPAKIPLVQKIRLAKAHIVAANKKTA